MSLKNLVTSLPALLRMTAEPPGCCSRKGVGSYTAFSITTQFLAAFFPTSFHVSFYIKFIDLFTNKVHSIGLFQSGMLVISLASMELLPKSSCSQAISCFMKPALGFMMFRAAFVFSQASRNVIFSRRIRYIKTMVTLRDLPCAQWMRMFLPACLHSSGVDASGTDKCEAFVEMLGDIGGDEVGQVEVKVGELLGVVVDAFLGGVEDVANVGPHCEFLVVFGVVERAKIHPVENLGRRRGYLGGVNVLVVGLEDVGDPFFAAGTEIVSVWVDLAVFDDAGAFGLGEAGSVDVLGLADFGLELFGLAAFEGAKLLDAFEDEGVLLDGERRRRRRGSRRSRVGVHGGNNKQ